MRSCDSRLSSPMGLMLGTAGTNGGSEVSSTASGRDGYVPLEARPPQAGSQLAREAARSPPRPPVVPAHLSSQLTCAPGHLHNTAVRPHAPNVSQPPLGPRLARTGRHTDPQLMPSDPIRLTAPTQTQRSATSVFFPTAYI